MDDRELAGKLDRIIYQNETMLNLAGVSFDEEKGIYVDDEEEPEEDEVANAVLEEVNSNPKDNTMLLRESNWISYIFGGSQRDSRNWWRKAMNGLVNIIEVRAQTAYTARSLSNIVRTISAFADNTKAHVHNLVGGGKNAIKSWEQCSHETWRMISGIRKSATDLAQSLGYHLSCAMLS